MFTMDDWLGLVILMVCIALAIALIVMFVVGCVKLGCWLSDRVDAFGTQRAGRSAPPVDYSIAPYLERADMDKEICEAFGVEPRTREEQVVTIQNYASVKLPLILHSHDPSKPLSADEIRELLQVDPSAGYYRGGFIRPGEVAVNLTTRDHEVWPVTCKANFDEPPIVTGIDMGAGDDITTHSLDSIIADLGSLIVGEHLEIRATTRFNAILNRLEAYRATP